MLITKKHRMTACFLFTAALLGFPLNSSVLSKNIVLAENKVNNKVDQIITLTKDTTYYYDLDGDGNNDAFYYQSVEPTEPDEYKATLNLYINDKLYLTRKDGGFLYEVQLCDLDTKDTYLDFYISCQGESDVTYYSSFARYNGETISELTGINENPASRQFNLYRYHLAKVNGDGTFTVRADTPVFSKAIGCYYCYLPYQVKGNELTYLPAKTYGFAKYSKTYKYKAKKAFTVYKTAGSKKAAFKVKKGAAIYVDRLYVSPAGKAYVRAVNSSGKKGWIRADLENLFYTLPLWG